MAVVISICQIVAFFAIQKAVKTRLVFPVGAAEIIVLAIDIVYYVDKYAPSG